MPIGKPLLVDQDRKEQGTVLSAQTTPLSTQVAAQKLSFADYGIGQANAKASFAVTDELVNMAGAMGKAAIYIDNTKKEHGRLNMMKDWQQSDDKYAQEFASAITYAEKTEVASRMQESIATRAKNYQSIGGSSLDAQKSLAALTNASRSSLSKMNISSAQRLVAETNTGYDLEAKRISSVIANDPTADMGVQFEKFRVLQNSKIASRLITPEQAEFQQIDFQRIAHTARGKLLGRQYADTYINGGAPLPSDEELIDSYQKNTNLILDDIQKNMFTDSIDDIYAKKVREYNSIEEAEMKSIRLQNFEQKETLASELEDAYTRGAATPEVVAGFLEKAKLFGDPNFNRKINKLITDNDYGAPDPNVVGEYTTPEQMELYTGKDFMKHGVYDLDAISKNLPTSANGRTKTDIRKFYNNLNVNLAKNFTKTVPNAASAALASLLEPETGDPAFVDAVRNFDNVLFGQLTNPTFTRAINYKIALGSHSKFSSVYNGVLAKADALAASKKGVFSDEYLEKNGPEARAEELQRVLGVMFKEDIQKVVDEENRVKEIAKTKKEDDRINRELDTRVMQDLDKKQRMKDGDRVRRENSENFRKYKDEQNKKNLTDDAKIEEGLKPIADLIISTDKSIGDTVDELLQPIDSDLVNIFEAIGKGVQSLDKSIEDTIHSIVTYTDHRVSKEMREGWDKTNEEANAPEVVPEPVTGKGLSEPMTDEMRNQGLADIRSNIEQSEQTPTAIDQFMEGVAQNPIVSQAVETVSSVLGLGGTAEAATVDQPPEAQQEQDVTSPATSQSQPSGASQANISSLPLRHRATANFKLNQVRDKSTAETIMILEGHKLGSKFQSEGEQEGPYGISLANFNRYTQKNYSIGDTPTDAEANIAYEAHMQKVVMPILQDLENHQVMFTDNEKRAMTSLLWNSAKGSRTLQAIAPNAYRAFKEGDKATAFEELFSSQKGIRKSEGRVLQGLVNRRAAEWALATDEQPQAPTPTTLEPSLASEVLPTAPKLYAKAMSGDRGIWKEDTFSGEEQAQLKDIVAEKIKKGNFLISYSDYDKEGGSKIGYGMETPDSSMGLKFSLGKAKIVRNGNKIMVADEWDIDSPEKINEMPVMDRMSTLFKKVKSGDISMYGFAHLIGEAFGPQAGEGASIRATIGTAKSLNLSKAQLAKIPQLKQYEAENKHRINPDNLGRFA
jgi:GH24 family phage-related lysozyme (muramidase)